MGIVRGVQSQRVWIYLKINKCKSVHLPPTCSVTLCLEVVPTAMVWEQVFSLGGSAVTWLCEHGDSRESIGSITAEGPCAGQNPST